jgi:hypothetical protein
VARVKGFVFDDSEIADVDPSGVQVSTRSLFDAVTVGPFKQKRNDDFLVTYYSPRSSRPHPVEINYWLKYSPLNRSIKDYFLNFPVPNGHRWGNWLSLAPAQVFDVRSFLSTSVLYYGLIDSENLSFENGSLSLIDGFGSGFAVYAAINLMPLVYVLDSSFCFSPVFPAGGACSVSFSIASDNVFIPDPAAFSIFLTCNEVSFVPVGLSGFNKWIWLKYSLSRPAGDLVSPCSISGINYSVTGFLWI